MNALLRVYAWQESLTNRHSNQPISFKYFMPVLPFDNTTNKRF